MRYLLLTANIIMGVALLLRVTATAEFDTNALSPTSAVLQEEAREHFAEQAPANRINCDAELYRASMDAGRRSGGVMLPVAAHDHFDVYGIDDGARKLVTTDTDPESEMDVITNFALYLCDGEFVPSDTYLPVSGFLRMAYNHWSLQGGIKSGSTGVS